MSFNQQLVTNPCKLNTYDTKCLKFINDALKETSESFEKEQKCMHFTMLCNYTTIFHATVNNFSVGQSVIEPVQYIRRCI